MIDIANELYHIENDILGEDVRLMIGNAMAKLSAPLDVDISYELNVIYNGRYGSDIRQAIYNALLKISRAVPTPVASDVIAGLTIPIIPGVAIKLYGETTVEE